MTKSADYIKAHIPQSLDVSWSRKFGVTAKGTYRQNLLSYRVNLISAVQKKDEREIRTTYNAGKSLSDFLV